MRITIRTRVAQDYRAVWRGFDQSLFTALSPPFPPVRLLRFDGSLKGDEVHIELNFLTFKQVWKSLITEQAESGDEIYFVDEGVQLPFFLKYWQHRHRIVRRAQGAEIVDDITFRTPFLLTDWLFYPLLYAQFAYRIPVYKRLFG